MRTPVMQLPGEDWERLDMRGPNSNRQPWGVLSPSGTFILTRTELYINNKLYEETADEIIHREIQQLDWVVMGFSAVYKVDLSKYFGD